MKYPIVVLLLVFLTGCSSRFQPEDAAWLSGTWNRSFNDAVQLENWKMNEEKAWGDNKIVVDFDTILMYHVALEKTENGWELLRVIENESIVHRFSLNEFSSDSLVFQNTEKFFPQEIVYYQKSNTRILVRERGTLNGMNQTVDFEFTKSTESP
jgi:hypothetical protein